AAPRQARRARGRRARPWLPAERVQFRRAERSEARCSERAVPARMPGLRASLSMRLAALGFVIELDHVSKAFRSSKRHTAALRDVSLCVERGELVCLVGPSGCGKTTILNLIAGLDRPDAGQVRINRRVVAGPGPDRGVLFQDAALFPWLTVEENVEFGL